MNRGPMSWRHRSLMHRVFLALVGSVVISTCSSALLVHSWGTQPEQLAKLRAFAAEQFAQAWDDPSRQAALVRSIESHFAVQVTIHDASKPLGLEQLQARSCRGHVQTLDVTRDGRALGTVELCMQSHAFPRGLALGLGLFVLMLWASSRFVARRLMNPLEELVRVVRDIGDGKLSARVELRRHCQRHGSHHRVMGEVAEVAYAVNQMAEKIERQVAGQKELLAAVSHEIRSPLARLRMLIELEREARGSEPRLDAMDVELTEMDALTGQLLAQSRLEFDSVERHTVKAAELARTALERKSHSKDLLQDDSRGATVNVDAGLVGRALLNLIDNAEKHGGGLAALRVQVKDGSVLFLVSDTGKGFDEDSLRRAFEPFSGAGKQKGLGLGLSLVKRIAEAHGGTATVSSEPGQGAKVVLQLPLTPQ